MSAQSPSQPPAGVAPAPQHGVDPAFTDLPLARLADAALGAAPRPAPHMRDFRFERLLTSSLSIRDTAVQSATDAVTTGFAVRVIVDGVWGFAASVVPTAEEAVATAHRAVQVARALSGVVDERVERADEPVYRNQEWVSAYRIDPFTVAGHEKIALLMDRSERLLASDGVAHTEVGLYQVKENKYYCDTAGTSTTQQRVRLEPTMTATAVDSSTGAFETMSSLTPPVGRGYEYLTDGSLGLRRRARGHGRATGGEDEGAVRRAGPLRPGRRPDEPVADHPRVDRSRHRVRPGHRIRGRLRRNLFRHAGQAGPVGVRLARDERHRRPGGGARAGQRRIRRRRGRRAVLGPDPGRHAGRLPAGPHVRAPAGSAALERVRVRRLARRTSRSSEWPTSACNPTRPAAPRRT